MNEFNERIRRRISGEHRAAMKQFREGKWTFLPFFSLIFFSCLALASLALQSLWLLSLGALWLTVVGLRVAIWGAQMGYSLYKSKGWRGLAEQVIGPDPKADVKPFPGDKTKVDATKTEKDRWSA